VLSEEWAAVAVHIERGIVPTLHLKATSDLVNAFRTYDIDYVLVTPQRAWRDDGGRQYTVYAQQTYLPFVRAMVDRGALSAVFEGPAPDHVRVYRVDATRLPGLDDAVP
jgi:hypothetical protein